MQAGLSSHSKPRCCPEGPQSVGSTVTHPPAQRAWNGFGLLSMHEQPGAGKIGWVVQRDVSALALF